MEEDINNFELEIDVKLTNINAIATIELED